MFVTSYPDHSHSSHILPEESNQIYVIIFSPAEPPPYVSITVLHPFCHFFPLIQHQLIEQSLEIKTGSASDLLNGPALVLELLWRWPRRVSEQLH